MVAGSQILLMSWPLAHHRVQMEFCYLGKSNCLIHIMATITFNLLHQGFLLGGGARGLIYYFGLVFYCSNNQYS